jgi:nicotinamide mononucleotide transporter
MSFFDIKNIAFEVLNYPISYVEFIGTFFGLLSVYFATKTNILTWSTGIVNVVFLFILFFQVQLYADMFLQVYYLVVTLFGWYNWKNMPDKNNIISIPFKLKIWIICLIFLLTFVTGFIMSTIHLLIPKYFKLAATFPYVDSFVMIMSIFATVLLAKKKIETWYLWIIVDLVCVFLFFHKEINFLAFEYLIFLGLATTGLLNWKKQLNHG